MYYICVVLFVFCVCVLFQRSIYIVLCVLLLLLVLLFLSCGCLVGLFCCFICSVVVVCFGSFCRVCVCCFNGLDVLLVFVCYYDQDWSCCVCV